MDETITNPQPQGIGRFTKYMILGAIFGGVLSAIPVLNFLNCLFCILNMAGIVFALMLYLKANPEDTLTTKESVGFGAIAGAGAGLIAGIGGILVGMVTGPAIAAMFANMPGGEQLAPIFAANAAIGCMSFLMIPINMILFAAFGILGSFLGMKLFFKNRIRTS
jgi:hypothetical protein